MLEVLVTLVIIAFGLLGLAGLNLKIQVLEMEAYQRAQGILLLKDMAERIRANGANAANYVSSPSQPYGKDNNPPSQCSGTDQASRDVCDWSSQLSGAAETTSSGANKLGAMVDARGCIEELRAPDASAGVCTPGMYRVTIAWQGMTATTAPHQTCGTGLYGSDSHRRALSADIVIGLPSCL